MICENCSHCLITYPCSGITSEDYPQYDQDELEELWKVENYQCTYDKNEKNVRHSPHVRPNYSCDKFKMGFYDYGDSKVGAYKWIEQDEVIKRNKEWTEEHQERKKE